MREMHTRRSCSSAMRISQTWLRLPTCSGRAVPITNPSRHCAHVIGVDLLADHPVLVGIDHEPRRSAAERLSERDRCTAVQDAERLPRAVVDRHAAAQEIRADLRELDAEVQRQAGAEKAHVVERVRTEPDHGFCNCRATRWYASRKEMPS